MKIQINDRISYAVTAREYTDEGFLRVPGRVARTGIQEYHAGELGLPGDPNRVVRVMRPAEEVFNDASLQSYLASDVTLEHPSTMVDTDTYKAVSVGTVEVRGSEDGDFVVTDLIIKDKDAIAAVESGKVQLSAGYTALYDDNVPEGADYEFIQREIRINHVALVDRARAGVQARLFDHNPGVLDMPFKVTLDGGDSVQVADEATAALVNGAIARLTVAASTAVSTADKANAERDVMKEQRDAAKKLSSPAVLSARVAAIASVTDSAMKIAGKEFQCDSTELVEIQRAALTISRPGVSWADKSLDYVQCAFDIGTEQAEEKENEDDDDDKDDKDDPKKSEDSHRQLAKDAAAKKGQVTADSFRAKSDDARINAWKTTQGSAV